MELAVYNIEGKQTGAKVSLAEAVFCRKPSDYSIYLVVKQYLANQRQGTHKTKERGEVSGSTKKPWKQKGTGNARSGHKRSPLWYGGGTAFGPRPRDYSFKVNHKVKVLARRSALSYKCQEGKIFVLDSFTMQQPKTKAFIRVMNNLTLADTKTLVVTGNDNKNVYLSGRNIPGVQITSVHSLNTYDILNAANLVLTQEALQVINEKF